LLLIGAYRDTEVDAAHPLQRTLGAIRAAGARVQEISLAPLTHHDVGQLMTDALHCAPARVAPLAQLVHAKTAGNPFFAMQFMAALADEGVLTFEHGQGCWSWDLERLHATGYTENVVDLIVGKLHRLPVATQEALQQLACLGHSAEFATLALVHETTEEAVHAQLWEAVRQEVIEWREGAYTFIHDRVQEAAYALIPEDRRAAAHLRFGRLLAVHTPPEERAEAIFELVQSAEPWRCADHGTQGTRAAGRTQPPGRHARPAGSSLRLGAHLSPGGGGIGGGGWLGAPACARVRARVAPRRM
jgi:predicted ATPase